MRTSSVWCLALLGGLRAWRLVGRGLLIVVAPPEEHRSLQLLALQKAPSLLCPDVPALSVMKAAHWLPSPILHRAKGGSGLKLKRNEMLFSLKTGLILFF